MAKKKKDKGAGAKLLQDRGLLKILETNHDNSDRYVNDARDGWEEKEKLLLGTLDDSLSKESAKSQVFDPRLSTVVIERAARVMGQLPAGKPLAVSKDDRGKNILMNLCLEKYVLPNANSQFDYLIKSRMMDVYSLVYGVMFGLVDWRIDEKSGYIGPDCWLLPIRDVFPQAGAISINECDWFQVSNLVGLNWLENRGKDWKNLDEIIAQVKEGRGKSRSDYDAQRRSHAEQTRHPDIAAKNVELITEYRTYGGKEDRGEWITYAPDFEKVVRRIDNPHENGELPIVAKHSFPLIDSIFGLGEFERGKTLQYAVNSLINLYLDGVKQSLFPPVLVNPDQVIPSSIKWQPAAKWLVRAPNAINQLSLSPQGLSTFQSTYSFLIAALMNQAGTTDTTVSKGTDPMLGRTPQALKLINERENARDSWDRFMMEKTQEQILGKFVNLVSKKQEKPIKIRLFEDDIAEIAKTYPDVMEMYEGGERGEVKVNSGMFESSDFDYQIVSGSTQQADTQKELTNLTMIFQMVSQNPAILQAMQQGDNPKTIDFGELMSRLVSTSGIQDWDKIITDFVPQQAPMGGPMDAAGGGYQFQDPDVAAAAQQILGGVGQVPAQPEVV